eukprot:TRINITY_DN1311_c0_g2_i1.p1 TRINITY_DN1311_c0_g2~~TRINITY_DN1311_c0_g2_i1.p1  ORF type:complete len:372 (+),score=79.42 TRINITY_DN1311_c0_g2_i1:37-1152(+)
MAAKARASGVAFRPHFKTHQSAEIGEWFREHTDKITVSSLDMAAYFASGGGGGGGGSTRAWRDITVAMTALATPAAIARANRVILPRVDILGLLVEAVAPLRAIQEHIASPVDIWIKIDVGLRRTGIDCDDLDEVTRVARAVTESKKTRLQGLLVHAGHSYHAFGEGGPLAIYADAVARANRVRRHLTAAGLTNIKITYGDTPTLSRCSRFEGVDEVRPGNFVLYDAMQVQLHSCSFDDVAVAVACPIVAIHPNRREVVIHGGAVHLSKEFICDPPETGTPFYGYVALPNLNATGGFCWGPIVDGAKIRSLTQEHGVVTLRSPEDLHKFNVGGVLFVIPVHSCLVVTLLKRYTDSCSGKTILAMEASLPED